MRTHPLNRAASRALRALAGVACACVAAACAAAPEAAEPEADEGDLEGVAAAVPAPWPDTFLEQAVLMAEVVRIEGPPGLREHLAVVQDNVHHAHEVETTQKGLLQQTVVRAGLEEPAPIRCQLDNVTIVAMRKLVVLERPALVPVSIVAEGEAFFKRTDSEEEQRGPVLRIVGTPK
jgi:hypothetical protein